MKLASLKNICLCSFSTDGTDRPPLLNVTEFDFFCKQKYVKICDIIFFSKMNKPDLKILLKNVYKDNVFTSVSAVVILFSFFVGIYIR